MLLLLHGVHLLLGGERLALESALGVSEERVCCARLVPELGSPAFV